MTDTTTTGSSTPAKQPKPTTKKETITTKVQAINTAWVEEIVAEIGIGGPLAKKVASDLAGKISTDFSRRYTRAKLVRLVRASLDSALE